MAQPRLYSIRPEKEQGVEIEVEAIQNLPAGIQRLTRVTPDSPEITRIAEEILRADSDADILAVLDRRDVRRVDEWAAAAHAYRVAPGVVICATTAPGSSTHRKGYLEAMLLLAFEQRAEGERLVFHHTRSNATAADIAPLLSRYALEHVAAQLPRKSGFASEITVSIPAAFLDIWLDVPRQRTRQFFRVYSRIAMALQEVFRRWIRFEWLADLRRFEDHTAGRAAIVYWLSPPRAASSYSEFVYDVMSGETLDRLCRGLRRLGTEFSAIAGRIAAANLDETTHWYRGNVKKIAGAVRRDERSLRRLLAMDSDVLDHLIGFGVQAPRIREGVTDPEAPLRHPIEFISDFAHDLRSHLRRGPLPEWSHDLATLVMVEATNAMRRELGLPHGVHVEVTVSTDGGRRLSCDAETLLAPPGEVSAPADDISSENLREADALPSQE
jgi:hypothetical protein